MSLSVVILTRDEEANLPACMESLRELDCRIFVVDSGSTDRTVEIAQTAGAVILHHAFKTHAKQWSWALGQLPDSVEWVLGLDADQRLSASLRQELNDLFRVGDPRLAATDGFYIKRRQVFRRRWIRHGGYYPKYLLKLFRKRKTHTDPNEMVDHHFYVEGRVGKLRHDLIEENHKENNISFWIDKHNRYAALLAREEFERHRRPNSMPLLRPSLLGNPDQRTLWLKRVWSGLPLYSRAMAYFIYRYFLRLGFLDGKEGFLFHFLQGFWFRVLVDAKLDELKRTGALIREPQ